MSRPHLGHSRWSASSWPAVTRLRRGWKLRIRRSWCEPAGVGRGPAGEAGRPGRAAGRWRSKDAAAPPRCGVRGRERVGRRGRTSAAVGPGGLRRGVRAARGVGFTAARHREPRFYGREASHPVARARTQRPPCHLPPDGQGRGRRGRRGVQHVHGVRALPDQEVVHQRAVPQDRLGPDPGRRGHQIRPPVTSGSSRRTARVNAPLDSERCTSPAPYRQCRAGDPPGAGPGQRGGQLARAHDPPAVPLAGQGRHGVRSDVDAAVDAPGQMHPEERERRVRHRIDQPAHQLGPGQLVVLAAERHDPHPRVVAGEPGHPVAVQPRAVDQHPGPDDLAPGAVRTATPEPGRRSIADDLRAVPDLRPGGLGQPPGDRREVADPRRPDVDRRRGRAPPVRTPRSGRGPAPAPECRSPGRAGPGRAAGAARPARWRRSACR